MDASLLLFVLFAVGASAASPLGGLLSLWLPRSSLLLSLAVGFAAGVLLGALSFEMVPKALQLGGLLVTALGLPIGVVLVWLFDLYINRGMMAGADAAERPRVRRYHRRRRPKGSTISVIAGGTAAEELIEGVLIGVSAGLGGSTGLVVAVAIAVDNVAEALSIGQLIRNEEKGEHEARRVLGWTGLIGVSLLVSAFGGYFLLQGLPPMWQGLLTAIGAGAMFYIATTGLVPEADSHHFEQSGGLAAGAGLLAMLLLTELS
jgi:zinc transporter, ZIP family